MLKRTAGLVTLMAMALTASISHAGSLEKLLMPGELSGAHAKYEDDCGACHDRTDKPRQRELCLGCHDHDAIATDIAAGTGYHGRVARKAQCNACHTEHKGRNGDIVHFDGEGFDHGKTDFLLTGAHAAAACAGCHKQGRKFREAPMLCQDCHRDDDLHRGKLGTDCSQCHDASGFKPARFDHGKTRFPLTNAHGQVACAACHRDPGFKGAPMRCVDCHAADDVHRGSRGADCTACHGTTAWKQSRYDHGRSTGYPLEGRHSTLACDACHRGGDLKAPLPRECAGCHAAADAHSARFGTVCADCHGQQEWVVRSFDHEKRAQFVLRGAHERLGCHRCHVGVLKQPELPRECYGCHAVDDAHAGSMGNQCQTCHQETGWRDDVRFDHDFAGFPLVGLHVSVPCEECHATRAYRDAPVECVACHRGKDVHEGRLGEACDSCHNANGWHFWQFDHGRQTQFALTGRHAQLGCRDCHREPAGSRAKTALPRDCWSCHDRDDIHDARFGRDCERCHGTDTFRRALSN